MKRAREVAHAVARVTCCEHPVLGWSHSITCDDLTTAITARDAEHRAELDALRKSYEDANARGGEANERLQRQLREAVDANVMSAALIERLRGELGRAVELLTRVPKYVREDRAVTPGSTRLSRLCLSIDAFLAPPPAESPTVQATPALEHDKNVIDGLRQNAQADEIDRRAIELRRQQPAPPDDIACPACNGFCGFDSHGNPTMLHRPENKCGRCNGTGGLAALEAKGEPGTHAFVPWKFDVTECGHPTTHTAVCGERRSHPSHAKGAKP